MILDDVIEDIEDRDNNLYRVYFNTAAIPEEERKAGYSKINRYAALQGYDNSKLVISTTERVDALSKELAIQSKSLGHLPAELTY